MSRLLAIDPGCTHSGWVLIDTTDCRPIHFGKTPNHELHTMMNHPGLNPQINADRVVIEMIASYGMPVGAEVFETCVWIGRYVELVNQTTGDVTTLIKRQPIKLHHCHTSKAKDSNITQALVDRFAMGEPNRGKGTKAAPGWFHGFAADVWQAYALAVYAADTQDGAPF